MFLLDTVVLSELRKNDRNPGLVRWISGADDGKLFVSVVTVGEIERGIRVDGRPNPARDGRVNQASQLSFQPARTFRCC